MPEDWNEPHRDMRILMNLLNQELGICL
jgi:hypothetical protein